MLLRLRRPLEIKGVRSLKMPDLKNPSISRFDFDKIKDPLGNTVRTVS